MNKINNLINLVAVILAGGFCFLEARMNTYVWDWFIVPLSGGRLPIMSGTSTGYWLMVGLSFIIAMLQLKITKNKNTNDSSSSDVDISNIVGVFAYAAVYSLLFGILALVRLGTV